MLGLTLTFIWTWRFRSRAIFIWQKSSRGSLKSSGMSGIAPVFLKFLDWVRRQGLIYRLRAQVFFLPQGNSILTELWSGLFLLLILLRWGIIFFLAVYRSYALRSEER